MKYIFPFIIVFTSCSNATMPTQCTYTDPKFVYKQEVSYKVSPFYKPVCTGKATVNTFHYVFEDCSIQYYLTTKSVDTNDSCPNDWYDEKDIYVK